MNSYYEDTLYPLQDRVLKIIANLATPFYLTGGTALSRCYFQHRYSDDLDFFVNKDHNFKLDAEKIVKALQNNQVIVNLKTDDFYSLTIEKILKVDLVNDVAAYFGDLKKHSIFSRIDNVENILSNKLTALISRDEPKDIVDIIVISENKRIDWKKIFTDVNSKAVGIFPPGIAQKLETFPLELLSKIKWVGNPWTKKQAKEKIEKLIALIL